MPLPEDTILENRYRIDGLLARGGMGAIYRAFDTNLNTPVAIKENFFQTPEHVVQFKQEALILARLRHPALPRVIQHFSVDDPNAHSDMERRRQYLVMDFIEGENLWEVVQRRGQPLEVNEALNYIIQVCAAVDYLHRQSPPIIHRDIKPQNIKITPQRQAVLVDFGIAKQVVSGVTRTHVGAQGITPGFSPPEQYNKGTSAASDIYALGATLYAIVSGQKPPDSFRLFTSAEQLTPLPRLNAGLPSRLWQAVQHAMQLESTQRPASVVVWQKELESIREGLNGSAEKGDVTITVSGQKKEALDGATLFDTTGADSQAVYWLVDAAGMGYPIGERPLVIGRHSGADIVLEELGVSRSHARLRLENGRCMVLDNGSANGTFINNRRLGQAWTSLNPGDLLAIGSARFYLTATRPARVYALKSGSAEAAIPAAEPGYTTRPTEISAPPPPPRPRSKRSLKLLWLALVVIILLAGLAGGGYFIATQPQWLASLGMGPAIAARTATVTATPPTASATNTPNPTDTPSPTATPAGLAATVTPRPTGSEQDSVSLTKPTATPTASPTRTSTTQAGPSPTVTRVPTRTPAASGPTAIPLATVDAVSQIGSREVIDVELNPQNPNEVYALVKGDGIYHRAGSGAWGKLTVDAASLVALEIDPNNPRTLYAPTWNAVLKSTDGGNTWDAKMGGLVANRTVDVVAVHPENPSILYAGIGETLVVSTDGGQNWSSQEYGIGLGVARFYEIAIDPLNPDIIYVGGEAGSVYKSENGGRNFSQAPYNTGKGVFGLAVHPRQSGVVLAGINKAEAGILRAENGWDFVSVSTGLIYGGADSAYSALVFAPSNPQIVYAGSGFESDRDAKGIFKSSDGGQTWNSISNGLAVNSGTGYPHYVKAMAVHPRNENVVYAATGGGLYRTDDGGATWQLQ